MLFSQSMPALKYGAILDQKAPGAGGTVMVPLYEDVTDLQNQQAAAAWAVSHTVYVADNAPGLEQWQIAGVSVVFGTTSASGTMQVEVATGTQAIAAGTNQLSSAMSLSGTANTTVNGVIIAAPTVIVPGSRVNLIFAGTVTGLANAAVTVALQRIA